MMGLFSWRKKPSLGVQPHGDWPWTLSVNGEIAPSASWEAVFAALDRLGPNGGFVILEQKKGGEYWFCQSAVALAGPHTGEYILGCGYTAPEGRRLIERCAAAGEVCGFFQAALLGKTLDFTGFEDQSDMLS